MSGDKLPNHLRIDMVNVYYYSKKKKKILENSSLHNIDKIEY